MDKFLKRKSTSESQALALGTPLARSSKKRFLEFNVENLPIDPGQRHKITDYHPNDQDEVRRAYLQKGPCQPRDHDFPKSKCGSAICRFNPNWFNEFGKWLEYSISKDAAFCLCCFLMKSEVGGNDAFVTNGFSNWRKKERLQIYVGNHSSAHNQAWRKCQVLMNQKQHIEIAICKHSKQPEKDYRIHLTAIIDCIRFMLRQGWTFRAHDESEHSRIKGNFLELLQFLAKHNEDIDNVLKNAHGNLSLVASKIQKDIVGAAAIEITKAIIDDLGDDMFAVLIQESQDISVMEQIAVFLRYVNKEGRVIERFLSLVHVSNISALSLKSALESLFAKYNLSLARIRGQGYEGANNMQDEFNGLKSLILKENDCAFYVNCFAHQLELALVIVAKKQVEIAVLFNLVTNLCNVVGASCKCKEIVHESQMLKVNEVLLSGEISSGHGLNQETTLKGVRDTIWDSHYGTILSLISMFSSIIDGLEIVEEDGISLEKKAEACHLLNLIQSFEFVFNLHLMKNILGVTNELSQALQRSDQDIVNAMSLVRVSKQRLQSMRDDDWHSLFNEVSLFCNKHNIIIPNMDDIYVRQGRPRHKVEKISNLHHFQVELFHHYILDVRFDEQFSDISGIGGLSEKLVETGKYIVYPLVYLLLKLALILTMTTTTVERAFAMNIIKNQICNRMEDEWLNDCLIAYIERELFDSINNEKIIQRFQNMKMHSELL